MKIFSPSRLFLIVGFTLYILHLSLLLLWAGSSSTITNKNQFLSGSRENLQIRAEGDAASLELLNDWVDTNIFTYLRPSVRQDSAFAYDRENKKIFLFGGSSTTALGDSWVYDPLTKSWEQRFPSPSARYGHNLVYVSSGIFVLFGGRTEENKYFNDTWVYISTANQWSKQTGFSLVPSSRAFASAVSLEDGNLILFGGYGLDTQRSSETWKYDLNLNSWTRINPTTSPSGRESAGMAYDPNRKEIVLFGGSPDGSNYLDDTWIYEVNTDSWTKKNLLSSPSKRSECSLVYDSLNRIFLLFAGYGDSGYLEDTWFYDSVNKWRQVAPLSSPGARTGHNLSYVPDLGRTYLFAGFSGTENLNDLWYYHFRSSGTFTSARFDIPFNTSLTWDKFIFSGVADAIRVLKFQIASASTTDSGGNILWNEFKGHNGENNTYYQPDPGTSIDIWNGHNNHRYLRFRAYFNTTRLPETPILDSFTIFYNQAPRKPSFLYSPVNNAQINDPTPLFSWENALDDDSDILTYELQVDTAPAFASPDIHLSGIVQSLPRSSTETTTALSQGKWYWRVSAYDGTAYSEWSEPYSFFVDTTPPTAVTDLVANIGSANKTIELSWTNTGDDGTSDDIKNGGYIVKWSSTGEITEGNWATIVDFSSWTVGTIVPQSKTTRVISNLDDATTYYFSLRIVDDAGNLSSLSNSPAALTNAPAEVQLLSPNGGENWAGEKEIKWTYSDPNPGDTHSFEIYLSTDNGNSYTILITSGLADKSTYYFWDSRKAPNGNLNRIKVSARDIRGLEGWDISDSSFTISNSNERPEITIVYPKNGEIISWTTYFCWTYSDPNAFDRHNFEIFISSDNGLTWDEVVFLSDQAYYLFYSTNYPNQIDYQLKIRIEDESKLWKEDSSVFGIANYNLRPSTFSLISPQLGRLYSFPLIFWWEEAVDPNGDEVTYTLYYSTDDKFSIAQEIKNLKDNFYHLPFFFEEEKNYYWKVKAEDPFGLWRESNETNYLFMVSRKKVIIDGLTVEISTGLPKEGYLKVDKISYGDYQPLSWANQRSLTDPMTRKIYDYAYRIGIYDTGDKLISPAGIKLTILYGYTDEYKNGYLDYTNIPVNNLRICKLEENVSSAFWSPAVYPQEVKSETKNVYASLEYPNGFPGVIISLLGYAPATVYLSEVANYPNPFNPEKQTTRIEYVLTQESNVTIRIYNLVGDLVWTKENAQGSGQPEGKENQEEWNGKNDVGMIVANGMYLCLISARPVQGGEERKISRLIGVVK